MTTNYYNTFIQVAEDCPASLGEVPPIKDPASIAQIEFDMLKDSPYKFTSDDVLFVANGQRRGITRQDFFAKGQPCFRSSPLTKRYGWGVHADDEGRIAIFAVNSGDYQRLSQDANIKQLKAMRQKRK
jgi:hypothetical protein